MRSLKVGARGAFSAGALALSLAAQLHAASFAGDMPEGNGAASTGGVVIALPALSDSRVAALKSQNADGVGPLAIGVVRDLSVEGAEGALSRWSALPGGGWNAGATVAAPGAAGVRLALRRSELPAGATVRFFDDTGEAAGSGSRDGELLWGPVVRGTSARIEVRLASGARPAALPRLVAVGHLLALPGDSAVRTKKLGAAGACEQDLTCSVDSGIREMANSVAMLVYQDGQQLRQCTGTLVASASGLPYLLTADHCLHSAASASSLATFWFYEAPACGADGLTARAVQLSGGSRILHHDSQLDMSLVRLNEPAPAGAAFAAWDPAPLTVGTTATILHHPQTDVTKVSVAGVQSVGAMNFGKGPFTVVGFSSGIVESGSSGSGLFTRDADGRLRLRGTLSVANTSCARPDGTAGFARLDLAYPAFKRFLAPPPPSPLAAAVLPASRSAAVGKTATAFATVINAGSEAATSCGIAAPDDFKGTFAFQTTDPATNAATGAVNGRVGIPAGASRTFIVSLTPAAPMASAELELRFACDGTAAKSVPGLNTLRFSAAATASGDVVALTATPRNDGILDVPQDGSAAFAVATVNMGSGFAFLVTPETEGAALPLELTMCETIPATGACLGGPAAARSVPLPPGGTGTVAVFARATGPIPFDPENSRISVVFRDSFTREIVGKTSVAVRTVP